MKMPRLALRFRHAHGLEPKALAGRLQLDGLAKRRDGLLEPGLVGQRIAEIVIGVGVVRPEPQRRSVGRDRLVELPLRPQCDT